MQKKLAVLFSAVALMSANWLAHADVSDKDMQLIGRALSFVEGGATGDVIVAIVYSDDVPGSKDAADDVATVLGSGLKAGKVTLVGKVISVSDVSSVPSGQAIFVPEGMQSQYSKISSATAITVSTDKACVDAGACVVSVASAPKVEIYVNRSAAGARSINFASAFRMMIKEI
mgnify:CR=1 FL=1